MWSLCCVVTLYSQMASEQHAHFSTSVLNLPVSMPRSTSAPAQIYSTRSRIHAFIHSNLLVIAKMFPMVCSVLLFLLLHRNIARPFAVTCWPHPLKSDQTWLWAPRPVSSCSFLQFPQLHASIPSRHPVFSIRGSWHLKRTMLLRCQCDSGSGSFYPPPCSHSTPCNSRACSLSSRCLCHTFQPFQQHVRNTLKSLLNTMSRIYRYFAGYYALCLVDIAGMHI